MFTIEAAASATTYGTMALLVAALMSAAFLLPNGEPADIRRQLISLTVKLFPLFVAASVVSLVIQGSHLNDGLFPTLDILGRYLRYTRSGKIWAMRQVYALVLLAGVCRFARNRDGLARIRVLLLFFLPLVASRSLTSHAISVRNMTALAVSADALHLLATALWAGGVPILFWVLFRGTCQLHLAPSWAAETVRRFSCIALASVAVLVATGLYQSWLEVERLALLFQTPYGQILILKLLLFLCMAAIGALNFFSTRPQLLRVTKTARMPDRLQKKTLSRIGLEAVLAGGVYCVTAVLTLLPPGIHSLHQSSGADESQAAPARLNFLARIGSLLETAPKLRPAQGAKVVILSPKEGDVFQGDEVPLRYDFVKGKIGDHVHAYVDGELMGMFSGPGSGTLTGIQPGKHVLELRVTTEDHVTELDATDRVQFVVK